MERISIKAPAKINLTLDVIGKREDGYHEVEMIMTTVDLSDRIDISNREDGQIILDSSAGYIPTDRRNLAYQAAELLKNRMNINKGVHIYIEKNIPVAAGLAGGSSDAAATLIGLNRLWNLNLSLDELAKIGAELGSDVPFCVYGGTAMATGRGELIRPLPSPPPCWVVLAKPRTGVSTADIYGRIKLDEIKFHPDNREMERALHNKDFKAISNHLGNVLEPVTFSLYPEVKRIKEQMIRFGGQGVLMSGSGPTVFALIQGDNRAHRVYNGLRGFCREVFMVRMLGRRGMLHKNG